MTYFQGKPSPTVPGNDRCMDCRCGGYNCPGEHPSERARWQRQMDEELGGKKVADMVVCPACIKGVQGVCGLCGGSEEVEQAMADEHVNGENGEYAPTPQTINDGWIITGYGWLTKTIYGSRFEVVPVATGFNMYRDGHPIISGHNSVAISFPNLSEVLRFIRAYEK